MKSRRLTSFTPTGRPNYNSLLPTTPVSQVGKFSENPGRRWLTYNSILTLFLLVNTRSRAQSPSLLASKYLLMALKRINKVLINPLLRYAFQTASASCEMTVATARDWSLRLAPQPRRSPDQERSLFRHAH